MRDGRVFGPQEFLLALVEDVSRLDGSKGPVNTEREGLHRKRTFIREQRRLPEHFMVLLPPINIELILDVLIVPSDATQPLEDTVIFPQTSV